MMRLGPVTICLLLATVVPYALVGPAQGPAAYQTIPDLFFGLFRHGNQSHLMTNIILLALGGALSEPVVGALRMLLLAAVSAALGLLIQVMLSGPGFVGLSGVAYGLMAFAMLHAPLHQRRNAVLIVVLLIAEIVFLRDTIAVFSHVGGAITGGVFVMLRELFGSKGAQLKPMEWKHVVRAIEIIAQTDEDDAAEADAIFVNTGYKDMFVLVEKGQVLGVTGFGIDDQVPDLAWLSWTYLDKAYIGRGYGAQMLNDLLGMLAKYGIRKIFIETSDYEDFGKKIYANAHRLYEEFGATAELTLPDYHAPGEAKILYGLDNPEAPESPAIAGAERDGLALTAVQHASETDHVAGLQWEEIPTGLAGVETALSTAWERGHRMALLAIPEDLSVANAAGLTDHGFEKVGYLTDYYAPGKSQDWWSVKPTSL